MQFPQLFLPQECRGINSLAAVYEVIALRVVVTLNFFRIFDLIDSEKSSERRCILLQKQPLFISLINVRYECGHQRQVFPVRYPIAD